MIFSKTMKPYSRNIIFADTEFSSLDPYKGEILSIGLVTLGGKELYLELEYDGEVSKWVRDNITPTLTQEKVSRDTAKQKIAEFVGKYKPYLVAYVNQFDVIYLYKLFGFPENSDPFFWLPIDFASMLFAHGRDPESLVSFDKLCAELGIPYEQYHQHNALDDARVLREVYLKLTGGNDVSSIL